MEKITLHTIAVLISHIYDHPLSDPICPPPQALAAGQVLTVRNNRAS